MNAIVPRATIMQIEANRARSLELYGEAFDRLGEAVKAGVAATISGSFGSPYFTFDRYHSKTVYETGISKDRDAFLKVARQGLDRGIWSHLIESTNLERLMDKTARDQFREQLREDPPEATAENCFATLSQLVGDSDMIFKRGIATAFAKLDRRFRSHDGFKIGTRVVLSYAMSDGRWNYHSHPDETLRDIERTFLTLDGKPHPERSAGFLGMVDAAMHKAGWGPRAYEVEDDYFRLRVFMNGNAHLWFKRPDLVEKVNLLLADYYGATLGAGADVADVQHAPKTGVAKNFGFFETPEAVRREVYERAGILLGADMAYGRKPERLAILEPSAGLGALAEKAARGGHDVTCYEIQSSHVEALRKAGCYRAVRHADFINVGTGCERFDVVIMNPPFDGGRDIDHVTHAMKFLKPGGKLAAVMSASVEFREDRKTVDFRAMVERYKGRFHDLPAGSFKDSGTMVNTVIVEMRAPG